MFFKINALVVFSCFLSFCFSENVSFIQKQQTQVSINDKIVDKSVIGITASNIRKQKNQYVIDIYADNMHHSIAGIQFNLIGEDFTILEINGGLAEAAGFNFYNGAKGVVLAFSLEGKTISIPKTRTPLLVLTIQKNNSKASELNLKTLIAGEKGVKIESVFTPIIIN